MSAFSERTVGAALPSMGMLRSWELPRYTMRWESGLIAYVPPGKPTGAALPSAGVVNIWVADRYTTQAESGLKAAFITLTPTALSGIAGADPSTGAHRTAGRLFTKASAR